MIADAYWPGENPIGRCVIITEDKACSTIVGVVENAMLFNLVDDDRAMLYIPWSHPSFRGALASAMIVRARASNDQLVPILRPAIQSLSPTMPFVNVEPYSQIVAPQLRSWRLGATMFSVFGIIATVIAAVGLYSVMAYWASQRTHEIGVRMALGAQRWDVVELLATHAARTVGVGIIAGVLIALAASRWVVDLLYDTSPREPLAYLVAALTLAIAAAVAIIVPARRVTRVDPATALRSD
jgi:ABC-type antimicrobial peptide transport system permease subunit